MTSRCHARQFLLDPIDLATDGYLDPPRSSFTDSNAANVRPIQAKLPGDTGKEFGVECSRAKVSCDRDIFGGHIYESHSVAVHQPDFIVNGLEVSSGIMTTSDWAFHIRELMKAERLTPRLFAAKLNVSEQTISNWVNGKKEPKWEMYFRMAKIWPDADQTPFLLKRAADISGAFHLPALEEMLSRYRKPATGRVHRVARKSGETTPVPLLKDAAAAGTPRQVRDEEIEEVLGVAGSIFPHPGQTVCIRVEGDSMSPILEDGYVVAIDTAEIEPVRLYDKMVAARAPDGGITIKWFRKVGKDEMLIPQHTSRRHQPVIIRHEEDGGGWGIVGKVLWWVGLAP